MHHLSIRYLLRRDLLDVLEIERSLFSDPWTEDVFAETMKLKSVLGIAVEDENERLVGYAVYSVTGRGGRTVQILRLGVDPQCHRLGYGRAMLERIARENRECIVEVRERNVAAQLFLRACGFRWAMTFHTETGDDVYLMKLGGVRPEDRPWLAQVGGLA